MKKTTAIIILFLASTITYSQDFPTEYQEVVEVPGVSSADLYLRAKEWFVNTYNDANKVIQMDDRESGTIIGKGNFGIYLSMNNRFVQHTIAIEVKDGKYRYSIRDFILDWGDGIHTVPFPQVQKMYHKKLFSQADEHIQSTIRSIKEGMQKAKVDW